MINRVAITCFILAICWAEAHAEMQIVVQFEDVAGGTTYPNASLPTSFVTEGVMVSLEALTSGSNAEIGTDNFAGSTGNELLLWANARAELDIGSGSSGGFFYYADLGGDNSLEINGATVDFDIVSTGTPGTVGGVSYNAASLGGDAHSVKLGSGIQSFALIGEELAVDRISLILVPEPSGLTLAFLALTGCAGLRRWRPRN